MDTKYIQELKVLSTQCDHNVSLGFLQSLSMMQDNMCEYLKSIGCDGQTMIPKCKCFFVLTKTKLKLLGNANWLDNIVLETYPVKMSNARIDIANNIYLNGNMIVCGRQELCAMDSESRRLRAVNTTLFPKDALIDNNVDLEFSKFSDSHIDLKLVDSVVVKTCNVDFLKHTNNLEYVKFMINTIPLEVWLSIKITDFEIHYIRESLEFDKLDIYSKCDNYSYYFQIKRGDTVVANAKLDFIK